MMIRQGDVLLVPAGEVSPDGWSPLEPEGARWVLAHGELSGHAHAIAEADATLWERAGTPARLLVVTRSTKLEHEEHAAVRLVTGAYYVHLQRAYVPSDEPRRSPGAVPVGD